MKVLLINGSPNKTGCTYTALHEVETTLHKHGIETKHFYLPGGKDISLHFVIVQGRIQNQCTAPVQSHRSGDLPEPVGMF